jgi:sporulation protein YlmC with PRC-barrel domain
MLLRIGAPASCSDGDCGQVSRIIVNPAARGVTHLVVGQKHRDGSARLVPVDLVDAAAGQVRLRCSLAGFRALQPAQETEAVPDLDPTGPHNSRLPPSVNFLSTAAGAFGVSGAAGDRNDAGQGRPRAPEEVTVDVVPSGEVGMRPELTVCATDGEIGQVHGVVMEPGGHLVTHVLVQTGRMLGRKDVAVPIGAVTKIGTLLINVSLSKHQVKDLPPADAAG